MTTTTSTTLDIVRQHVGRRSRITRDEMAAILSALGSAGLRLSNGYVHETTLGVADAARTWAAMCRDITCISVMDARGGSLRDGDVRYDEPGSMHPLQRVEVTFVPAALGRYEYDQIGQMRRHAVRVLIVREDDEEGAGETS